jgi:hypothetical protein
MSNCKTQWCWIAPSCWIYIFWAYPNKYTRDMEKRYRGLCMRANVLIRRFSTCNANVKAYLFKTYCTTMHCWVSHNRAALNKLRILYNNAYRWLMKYLDAQVPVRCLSQIIFRHFTPWGARTYMVCWHDWLRSCISIAKCNVFLDYVEVFETCVTYVIHCMPCL